MLQGLIWNKTRNVSVPIGSRLFILPHSCKHPPGAPYANGKALDQYSNYMVGADMKYTCYQVRYYSKSNGQNQVHPEARWPKPGTPFHASPRAHLIGQRPPRPDSGRISNGSPDSGYSPPHRLPGFNHTYPIMAGLFDQQPTRARAHADASSRHGGTRRGIFAVDVVVRAAEL